MREIVNRILREEIKTIDLGCCQGVEVDWLPPNTMLVYGGKHPNYQCLIVNIGGKKIHE